MNTVQNQDDIKNEADNCTSIEENEQIPSQYECVICLNILWKPVTTPCCHNFCFSCLQENGVHRTTCPLCRTPIPLSRSPNIPLINFLEINFPRSIKKRSNEITQMRIDCEKNDNQQQQYLKSTLKELLVYNIYREYTILPGDYFDIQPNTHFLNLVKTYIKNYDYFGIITHPQSPENFNLYGTCVKIHNERPKVHNENIFILTCESLFRFSITKESILTDQEYIITKNFTLIFDIPSFPTYENENLHSLDSIFSNLLFPFKITNDINKENLVNINDFVNNNNLQANRQHFSTSISDSWNQYSIFAYIDGILSQIGFEIYQSIPLNTARKHFSTITELYSINNENHYLLTINYMALCLIGLKKQLTLSGQLGRRLFVEKFGRFPNLKELPLSSELEHASFFLSRIILASTSERWKWFLYDNTLERTKSLAEKFLFSNNNILNLGLTKLSYIQSLFMLDSSFSSFLLFLFILLVLISRIMLKTK